MGPGLSGTRPGDLSTHGSSRCAPCALRSSTPERSASGGAGLVTGPSEFSVVRCRTGRASRDATRPCASGLRLRGRSKWDPARGPVHPRLQSLRSLRAALLDSGTLRIRWCWPRNWAVRVLRRALPNGPRFAGCYAPLRLRASLAGAFKVGPGQGTCPPTAMFAALTARCAPRLRNAPHPVVLA